MLLLFVFCICIFQSIDSETVINNTQTELRKTYTYTPSIGACSIDLYLFLEGIKVQFQFNFKNIGRSKPRIDEFQLK